MLKIGEKIKLRLTTMFNEYFEGTVLSILKEKKPKSYILNRF